MGYMCLYTISGLDMIQVFVCVVVLIVCLLAVNDHINKISKQGEDTE